MGQVVDGPSRTADLPCPACQVGVRILVAIRHRPMRRLTRQLLQHDVPDCLVEELRTGELLVDAVARVEPAVLVVDTEDFPACCQATLASFPPRRVIVIGPEPEAAYRTNALGAGAGAWVPRERISQDLHSELGTVLGCTHHTALSTPSGTVAYPSQVSRGARGGRRGGQPW